MYLYQPVEAASAERTAPATTTTNTVLSLVRVQRTWTVQHFIGLVQEATTFHIPRCRLNPESSSSVPTAPRLDVLCTSTRASSSREMVPDGIYERSTESQDTPDLGLLATSLLR